MKARFPAAAGAAALAAAALFASSARAADVDAGAPTMPCLAGVCVGDDLQTLLALPWQPVVLPQRPGPQRALGRMADALRGQPQAVEQVLHYWPFRWFDEEGLRALASLDAVCDDLGVWWRPRAALMQPNGHQVVVTFEPVASEGAQRPQRFRVATVSMRLAADAAQDAQQLRPQYDDFPRYPTSDEPGVRWLTDGQGRVSLTLFAPLGDSTDDTLQLREQSACHAPADAPTPQQASLPPPTS